MANGDPQKFGVAFRNTVFIFGTAARNCDKENLVEAASTERQSGLGDRSHDRFLMGYLSRVGNLCEGGIQLSEEVIKLGSYLAVQAALVSEKILNCIDSDRSHGPGVGLAVYKQSYIFFLHIADRIAFSSVGDSGRESMRDQLDEIIFESFEQYLSVWYRQTKHMIMSDFAISALVELEKEYFPMSAYLADLEYAKQTDYEQMKDLLGELLIVSLAENQVELDSDFKDTVGQALVRRGHSLQELVDAAVQGFRPIGTE